MPRGKSIFVVPKRFKLLCPLCAERMRLQIGGHMPGSCEKCGSKNSHKVIYPGGK